MNQNLTYLVRYNFLALHSLASFLKSRGYWTTDRSIEADVALTVYDLFDSIAWSDRSLHDAEASLLDALLQEDERYGETIRGAIAAQTTRKPSESMSRCLAAAALHDSIHQTFCRELFLNYLEGLALIVMMADSRVTEAETQKFRATFSELRKIGVVTSDALT